MRISAIIAISAALALSACEKPAQLSVSDAWVRLPAVKGQPGSAYFTVHGGMAADRLVLVTADYAVRSEMHESVQAGGMMTMKPLDAGVAVPAAAEVAFKPGGKHVMLFDLRPDLKPPATMPLNLSFASGTTLTIQATLQMPGDK